MDLSVGLALEGQKPFCYSITPFLLWRPAESIRLYLGHENIPVRLVGSGRGQNYAIDGFTHDATDAQQFLAQFPNIRQYWPETKEQVPGMVRLMVANDNPHFISLTR
jgi:transketolase